MRGLERYNLPTGARYLKLHHYADPSKQDEWLADIRQKMADTPDDFRREILMDETVHGGEPVYPQYDDDLHVYRRDGKMTSLPVVNGSLYFGGWDCGATLSPAYTLTQVAPANPQGTVFQIHCLLEVTSQGGESMEEFAPRVMAANMKLLPGNWDEIRHFGDATVMQRAGTNKKTAQDEAKRHGIKILPVSNVWAPRLASVNWLLARRLNNNTPGFLIDGNRCPILRAGFQGAYKYNISASGDTGGPGQVLLSPLKNMYSHVHDSLQQQGIKIRSTIEGTGTKVHR